MPDPVRELYSEKRYPALSHPVTDIAKLAVAARVGGLQRLPQPGGCRVLEFGCASGHNLLPMASRYPNSEFSGLDYSDTAIRNARKASWEAKLENALFEVADLEHWRPSHPCDYLIVHGVFSWVPDSVKARVLDLCAQVLSESGIVCLSYNTLPGWSLKQGVVPLVRSLAGNPAAAGLGGNIVAVAESLAAMAGSSTAHAANLQAVCREIVRKGPEVLPFDDFAPVCDPIYFAQLAGWAAERGLRYLGEADLRDNLPDGINPAALESLAPLAAEPLLLQQTLDLLSGRTHRNSLFCREDAPVEEGTTTAVVMQFAAGLGDQPLGPGVNESGLIRIFREVLAEAAGSCLPIQELLERTAACAQGNWEPTRHSQEIAHWIFHASRLGGIELRTDEIRILPEVPAKPEVSRLNRYFAANSLPVVDARHVTCRYPDGHGSLMALMDGSRGVEELGAAAAGEFPNLDFERWMKHLTERGILC
ncbi:class I SAM-dependent methyltransferase [Haloferula sp. BvORR071]|uniref:class I SAM-dependent methyltransferase n=1 Tax=Haloferula sp. BvORR071 TaxID=1396141 RepID=UPI002240F434|nr:class I SAM-dependent methyltransferase [Haloferula sp. BvORR071]